jgi:GNAT superfamily N-acetyltransferase
MQIKVVKAALKEILPLRALFLQETNFQIRYNACHERGWTDSYLLTMDDRPVGYGSVKGQERKDRDTIFEFYVIPPFRSAASQLFQKLLIVSGVTLIECQSNDGLLSSLLYAFAENIHAPVILFKDHVQTDHRLAGAVFRAIKDEDDVFDHTGEPVGDYILELDGEVVATGGFLLHYNLPFADLFMEVKPDHRRKGFGSLLLQEIKKECYQAGRVPAARCHKENAASHATLLKAGLAVAGFMLVATVACRPPGKR